ncbi:hypothetical protein BC936DRAFT_148011 [Jimgerdemannia flammicorona]|uniref:Uncharacterized protein n=2 Tax=Jimgerdemannia flammicorona TaxID=994334 RepID=A0A433D418_9FUNG|nr:hypothetical protein BC936DRAFT_148011 [Jimgerdemannia flammicorona]RUS33111.1 hypothetical protein BC938DRAFT_473043 [Jimgerdemannia flammicorona]
MPQQRIWYAFARFCFMSAETAHVPYDCFHAPALEMFFRSLPFHFSPTIRCAFPNRFNILKDEHNLDCEVKGDVTPLPLIDLSFVNIVAHPNNPRQNPADSADRERMHLDGEHFAPPTPLLRPLSSGGCQLPPIRSSLRTPPPMSPPNSITPCPTSTETQVPHMNSRREAHILAEQKRRGNINLGFDELKSVVPTCANTTDSKAMILKKGMHWCK